MADLMRAAVITMAGGPEVIAVQRVPIPAPGPDELLIRVRTSALNRADLLQRAGFYPAPPGAPANIGGIEFAGEIAALGAGVSGWKVGDRVFAISGGGAHAEYCLAPAATVVAIPEALGWQEAGAIPEAFMTAHDALCTHGGLQAGEGVLVHAVASGVGLAATQLAVALGARVFGTTRTPDKLQRAIALGLHDGLVVDADLRPLRDAVLHFTNGRGADLTLDLLGGPYLAASIDAAAPRARILLVGAIAGAHIDLDIRRVLAKRLTLQGTVLRSRTVAEKSAVAQAFAREVLPLLASGAVSATIDRTYPLEEIATAHAFVEGNGNVGKVVITI